MSEPNSKFPKVSSCHGAPLRIVSGFDNKDFYVCAEIECQAPCNAVPDEGLYYIRPKNGYRPNKVFIDEGLDGKGYKNMPAKEKAKIVSNAVKGANEDQRKLVEGLEEKRCIACEDEKERNSTVEGYYHDCAKRHGRRCLNCNTETPDTPCPYCGSKVFKFLTLNEEKKKYSCKACKLPTVNCECPCMCNFRNEHRHFSQRICDHCLPPPDAKEEKLTAKDLEDAIKMLESMPDQNESLAAIAKLNGIPVIESSLVTRPTLVVPNKQSFLEQFNPTTP